MKDKTLQEKICEFMEWKAEQLKFPKYFNKNDREVIMSWGKERAKQVIAKISLDTDLACCPFCIVYVDKYWAVESPCKKCPYGWHHGICDGANSDFRLYVNQIKTTIVETIGKDKMFKKMKKLFGYDNNYVRGVFNQLHREDVKLWLRGMN